MTFKEKIMLAKKNNIFIPFDLADNQNIVGVYKIFGKKNGRRTCLYIGKSTNIAYRLLGSGGGHIYMYLNNNLSKLVPCIIDKYIKDGYKIEIEIDSRTGAVTLVDWQWAAAKTGFGADGIEKPSA